MSIMKKSFYLTVALVFYISLALAQRASQVDSLVSQYYDHSKPGIALSILQNGKTVQSLERGIACIEHNIAISDTTSFQIASVSKQFTAYLALRLEQESKLDIKADIRDYLPELSHLEHKISIAQLANHTHGLPNVTELLSIKGFGGADRMWHQDVVDVALRIHTFNFKPGEQFEYNNTGFVLLAEIIARQSGVSFQQALEDYIFTPLGMDNTIAESSPNQLIKNKSESYVATPSGYQRNDNNIMSNGSSGIRTTIKDLTTWAQFFHTDLLDSQSTFLQMVKKSTLNSGEHIPYGLGLETKTYRGTRIIFHGGGTAGHRAYVLHIPDHKFSVVILGNSNDYWPLALAYEIVDLFLDDQLESQPHTKVEFPSDRDLNNYEGIYEFFSGKYFEFSRQEDSLFFGELGGAGKEYIKPLGNNRFEYPFYPQAELVFKENCVDLHIADFVYSWAKSAPVLKEYTVKELSQFTGFYRNESLNTIYQLSIIDNKLVARHPINYDVPLSGLADDRFFSTQWFFSQAVMQKNEDGVVTGFKLSGQNFMDLQFDKLD